MSEINWQEALRLYFIAGTQDVKGGELLPVLEQAIESGISCFQLREKGPGALKEAQAIKHLAEACQRRCQQARIPFVVNDDVALAIAIGADGVHVGQSDQEIHQTIQTVRPYGIEVGLSVNSLEQLRAAQQIADLAYIGLGPVYATRSKVDAQPVVGLELLKAAVAAAPHLPKVAIGGIDQTNAAAVRATGVDGLAVISAISASSNIPASVRQLGGSK